MTTISPLASNDKSPWIVVLVVGYVLGHYSHNVAQLVDQLLVPLYTIGVTLYLASRVLGTVIQKTPSLLLQQLQEQPKSVPVPLFLPQTNVDAILHAEQPIDLTGAWKLVENNNFEEFLATQGVPWPLRSAANKARPTHRITHRGNMLTIKIEGIIESQTTYIINGPQVQCRVRGRLFEDLVSYLPEADGVQVLKRAIIEKYTIQVCRRLSKDQQQITLTSTATFDDGRDSVQSTQLFARME
jgi:hypothetical protein